MYLEHQETVDNALIPVSYTHLELKMIENTTDLSEDEKAKILDTTEDNEVVVKFKIGEMIKSLFK